MTEAQNTNETTQTQATVNGDGQTDARDIQGFVAVLLNGSASGAELCAGDFNHNGSVDAGDVALFVALLLS